MSCVSGGTIVPSSPEERLYFRAAGDGADSVLSNETLLPNHMVEIIVPDSATTVEREETVHKQAWLERRRARLSTGRGGKDCVVASNDGAVDIAEGSKASPEADSLRGPLNLGSKRLADKVITPRRARKRASGSGDERSSTQALTVQSKPSPKVVAVQASTCDVSSGSEGECGGPWTREETSRFAAAVVEFGEDVLLVCDAVGTRKEKDIKVRLRRLRKSKAKSSGSRGNPTSIVSQPRVAKRFLGTQLESRPPDPRLYRALRDSRDDDMKADLLAGQRPGRSPIRGSRQYPSTPLDFEGLDEAFREDQRLAGPFGHARPSQVLCEVSPNSGRFTQHPHFLPRKRDPVETGTDFSATQSSAGKGRHSDASSEHSVPF